jgi:uncharacterized protein YndB with AHSA1/START domain
MSDPSVENLTARASIRIHKPAAEVMAAITEAEKMSQYWFTRSDDGLKQGELVTFALGTGADAFSFEADVKELDFPNKLVFEWAGPDGHTTQVTWICEETAGSTVLSIEESGFSGSSENIITRAIDSKGGFNQVIVAAKAYIEHGISVNVVADHA